MKAVALDTNPTAGTPDGEPVANAARTIFEALPAVCLVGSLLGLAGGSTGGVPSTFGPTSGRASTSNATSGVDQDLYLAPLDVWGDVTISDEARNFVHRFPAVKALAIEALGKLRHRLALKNPRLDVFADPEASTAPTQAFLVATVADSFDRAQDGLRLFDEEWWLDNCQRAEGRLQVTIEFG